MTWLLAAAPLLSLACSLPRSVGETCKARHSSSSSVRPAAYKYRRTWQHLMHTANHQQQHKCTKQPAASARRSHRVRQGSKKAMAAPGVSVVVLTACLVVLLGLSGGAAAQGQCVPQLNRLLACRAYLVPGAPDPSADCCGALTAVSQECACSTMGIISSLPRRCNLAPVNCSAAA